MGTFYMGGTVHADMLNSNEKTICDSRANEKERVECVALHKDSEVGWGHPDLTTSIRIYSKSNEI